MIVLRTQMNPKTTPLVLAMFFTLVCTLPAAGAVPAAIAQEEDTSSLDEDLARSIISDVLDGGDDDEVNDDAADAEIDDQDSADTSTVNPNHEDQTVDQTDFNEFGDNTAVSIDIDKEEQLTPTPPPDDGLPSEGEVFCFQEGLILGILCSDTLEDCEFAQEQFENVISKCEGFETPPPDATFCSISEGREIIRCESRN
jgi:hypothetical protein